MSFVRMKTHHGRLSAAQSCHVSSSRYDMQETETQERVQQLVKGGQLDFANGGWVSNDEAITQYEDIIDQMTLGHRWGIASSAATRGVLPPAGMQHFIQANLHQHCCRWLAKTFGYVVRQHWQLDTFGHSSVTPALAALGGMDSMFFSRLDKQVGQHQCYGAPEMLMCT
jgi:Glycosyl hydrolases family 38 N-terminal domain